MSLQWFKFYGSEYLSDPKISSLTPQERSCWVTLLCLGSTSSEPGVIEYLTVEALLEKSGLKWDPYHPEEWEGAKGVLLKLERMKMIKMSESGTITIINWEKRQESFLTGAERAAKYRAKKKLVAPRNTSRDKSSARIDKNRIIYECEYFTILEDKHNEYKELYNIDLIKEYKKMKIWLDDNPTKRKTTKGYPRFISSWLSRTNVNKCNNSMDNQNDEVDFYNNNPLLAKPIQHKPLED